MSIRRVSLSEIAEMPSISSHYKLCHSLRHLECVLRRQGLVYKAVYVGHPRLLGYCQVNYPQTKFYLVEPTDFLQVPVVELKSDDRWLLAGYFQHADTNMPNDVTPNVMLWHPILLQALPSHG